VALFLGGRIGYNQIYDCVAAALERIEIIDAPELEEVLEADSAARTFVEEHYS
jgi:1-deoxy-D-xylulose 5-phosphate reductoisomerase